MTLSLALLISAASFAAEAQERFPKWYVGLQGALSYVDDTDVDVTPGIGGDLDFDTGYGFGLALGYMPAGTGTFFDMMRFDLEYYYRKASLDSFDDASIGDDLSSNSVMLNAYYDFNTGTGWLPYVGAGIGLSEVTLESPAPIAVDDEDTVFAWNLMAGVGYTPATIPNTVWSLGYRYFSTSDPEFGAAGGVTIEHEYDAHNLEAGVRLMF